MAKILIIEDEKDIRQLVIYTLQYAGYQVVAGVNGEEAVALAKQERPDLILMDVRMPRMDGYQAAQLIKNDELTQHIPIVFLSAKGQESEVEHGFEVGAEDYLIKPFNPTELIDRIRSVVDEIGEG
jgi:DNA-binding response OmpR family regulator